MQSDILDQFVHKTDSDLLAFLRDNLTTLVQWDVLQFFHHNPHTMDTPARIARSLGRERETVEEALVALTSSGLLRARVVEGETIYILTNDEVARAQIERFMRACDDPSFRRGVIEQILQSSPAAR